MLLQYSFIIPVFNRPEEIEELLQSFAAMSFKEPFEIVIVEDGSSLSSESLVASFSDSLNIAYYSKANTGPGDSRNYGMRKANGNYFIILDSDVLMRPDYLNKVDSFLKNTYYDCFGGADAAHDSFSPLQKAINYVMTSFLTTGGIRGSRKSVSKYEPRSFNMGISKKAFEATGGFAKIHPGEDPDLSHRIVKAGFKTVFIPDAAVFHKRRISWQKFHLQVKKFGMVRPILTKWHPEAAKLTFWFPTFFVFFSVISVIAGLFVNAIFLVPLLLYVLLIFIGSLVENKSIRIAGMTVLAVFVQFFGYGLGFLKSTFYVRWLNKEPQEIFPHLFFD